MGLNASGKNVFAGKTIASRKVWPTLSYTDSPTSARNRPSLAVGKAPAVLYPASVVGSVVARADMESASPMRQSLRTAADEPEELSASSVVLHS